MNYDKELIDGFIEETTDVIDEVEPSLIELSKSTDSATDIDRELLNAIFRLFHSMKSSAAFLGFENIAHLTHVAESLIQEIREDRLVLTPSMASTLCKTTDIITEILNHIKETGDDRGFEDRIEDNISALSAHGSETPPSQNESSTPAPKEKNRSATPETGQKKHKNPELISPEMHDTFITEANEQLDLLEQSFLELESEGYNEKIIQTAYRTMHSFKGNCSFMGFSDPEKYSHLLESILTGIRERKVDFSSDNIAFLLEALDLLRGTVSKISQDSQNSSIPNLDTYTELMTDVFAPCFEDQDDGDCALAAPTSGKQETVQDTHKKTAAGDVNTPQKQGKSPAGLRTMVRNDIRVKLDKLDEIINLTGELVIAESMVTRNPLVAHIEDENYNRAVHQLRRICSELQDSSMALRMIPLSSTFRKMIRVVHDLSQKVNKKIDLSIVGEDTEVDKTVIELIGDPLVHIIRNSCDHGLESPHERTEAKKSETGRIQIEGRHEGGEVWIIIEDDGRGLDRDKILNKAISNGLVNEDSADSMTDDEIYKLIFEPGFSTAESISDVSGRGVGMDVVKKNIEKMSGEIDIRSTPGKGSAFIIRIPLTLAIIDGMLIRIGDNKYTIPTLSIKRSITCTQDMINYSPEGNEILNIDNGFLPIIKLGAVLRQKDAIQDTTQGIVIIVEQGAQQIALLADEIIGQQQTVIKGLSEYLGKARGTSGCTILGDGSVSLILDIRSLMEIADEMSEQNKRKSVPF
ncbi:MAG: Hpt domain-containing protein [Fibrobacterota bacterium]